MRDSLAILSVGALFLEAIIIPRLKKTAVLLWVQLAALDGQQLE
jgi:hypothetical protein